MEKSGLSVVLRGDVRFRRRGDYLYVCSSDGAPLRMRLDPAVHTYEVGLADLPDAALSSLIKRGLVVSADNPLLRHPSFARTPAAGQVRVVGEDQLSASITAALTDAGIATATSPDDSCRAGVVVLALTSPDDVLRAVAEQAVRDLTPVVVYASAGARVYVGVLRPPTTACPLCLSVRIRASRPDQELASLPLDMLLGTSSDTAWPSSTAAAGLVAHQAIRVIANPGSVDAGPSELVELDLDTCERVGHPLLHTPHCPACREQIPRGTGLPQLRDRPAIGLEDSWQRMRRAVDPLTGIVAGIRVILPEDTDSTVDSVSAWARGGTDTSWFSPVSASTVGGATKHDALDARVCALGEVLERYAAGIYDPARLVRASQSDLGPVAVDPVSLPLGSPREYEAMAGKVVPYHPDLVIDWVEGVQLGTGEQRYVPACCVYLPYQTPRKCERLLSPVSTGLAAGSTPEQAVRGGLLEVIERDAAVVCWLNQLTLPTLDWQGLPPCAARTVLERMHARGITLLVKDMTTDLGIPAVMVHGRLQTPDRPVALCGFRADVDPYACLLGAAEELEHCFSMYWRFSKLGGIPDETATPSGVWDFATYYCHDSRVGLLDGLYDGPLRSASPPVSRPLSDAAAIDTIVDRLSANGHQAIAVDITPVDVAECGVFVVKSVVAGLQPVSFYQKFRHLGGRRLYTAPVRMGLRDTELAEHELNPNPVPLG